MQRQTSTALNAAMIIGRGSAIAAFVVTLVGFALYPRPWGSHWSPEKIIAFQTISLGSFVAFASFVFCFGAVLFAGLSNGWSQDSKALRTAMLLNLASFAMAIMTPRS